MSLVVMVTMCARDNLQHFLLIMLELCPVPDVVYYARFSARLICGGLIVAHVTVRSKALHSGYITYTMGNMSITPKVMSLQTTS